MTTLDVLNEFKAYLKIISRKEGRETDAEKAQIIIDALEKQIPKRPIDRNYPWAICPVCGGSVSLENVIEYLHNQVHSHCEHCGQALDWSDTE